MLIGSLSVLLPIFFVMGLGYWAGRTKRFDADQIQGINELVLDFALPALMFVGTVTTTRSQMFAEVPFLLALLVAFFGLFIVVVLVSLYVLHHSLGAASLQASLIAFPSVAFFGIPIFRGLFGEGSILSIASADVLASITIVPATVVLLEIHAQRTSGKATSGVTELVWSGLVSSFKKPMVWAPVLGVALVLLDIQVPSEIDKMFSLIGSTTAGASIFLAGLIIASYQIRLDAEVIGNALVKMIVQPLLMVGLVAAFGVENPLGREAILMCAIPTAVFAPILAPRYKVYEIESSSTLVLTALIMIVTFPLAVYLTGG